MKFTFEEWKFIQHCIECAGREFEKMMLDKVKLDSNAPVYGGTSKFASWVYSSTLYLRELNGNRAVISTQKTGAVTGAVDKKYLKKI